MSSTTPALEGGTEGDFKLVSSDKKEFTFKTYRLQAWSDVLRDMVSTGSGEKIVHLDEHSSVIRLFLELVTRGKLEFKEQRNALCVVRQLPKLIRFLKKYECGVVLEQVVGQIMSVPQEEMPPLFPFLLGVETGRPELCARALDCPELAWKSYMEVYEIPVGICPLANMLHPAELPPRVFMSLPHSYLWALVQLRLPLNASPDMPKGRGAAFLMLLKKVGE